MARISWFSASEASSGPKFKSICEIAESRNVHPSIWLVSAMVTDMWHMIIRCTTPSTGQIWGEVVVGTLYTHICPVDGVVHRNIGFRLFVHGFRLAFWSIKSFETEDILVFFMQQSNGHGDPGVVQLTACMHSKLACSGQEQFFTLFSHLCACLWPDKERCTCLKKFLNLSFPVCKAGGQTFPSRQHTFFFGAFLFVIVLLFVRVWRTQYHTWAPRPSNPYSPLQLRLFRPGSVRGYVTAVCTCVRFFSRVGGGRIRVTCTCELWNWKVPVHHVDLPGQ